MQTKFLVLFLALLVIVPAGMAVAATTHTMKSGDTLWELSAKHYGDPTLYPILLQVNGIDNPRTIPNGRVIIIPDKSAMQAIAKEKDPAKKQQMINQYASGSPTPAPDNNNNGGDKPADDETRYGEVNPEDTTFINILKGPKTSADKLIKVDETK